MPKKGKLKVTAPMFANYATPHLKKRELGFDRRLWNTHDAIAQGMSQGGIKIWVCDGAVEVHHSRELGKDEKDFLQKIFSNTQINYFKL